MTGRTAPVSVGLRLPLARLWGWTAFDVALAAAMALGTGALMAVALALLQARGVALGPPQPLLGGLPALYVPLSLFGSVLAGAALCALHRRRLPAGSGRWTPGLALRVVVTAIALQAAGVAATAAAERFGLPVAGSNLSVIAAAYAAAPVLTVFATVVLAPLGEELVFRRVLLHRFAQSGHAALGLVVTSLGFALIHEPMPGDRSLPAWLFTLGTYTLLGLGFGTLYLRARRIDAAILAHMLVNAIGMGLLLRSAPG